MQLRILSPGLGNGLLTADGESWRLQRRSLAPLFSPRHIAEFALPMQKVAAATVERLRRRRDGAVTDVGESDVAAGARGAGADPVLARPRTRAERLSACGDELLRQFRTPRSARSHWRAGLPAAPWPTARSPGAQVLRHRSRCDHRQPQGAARKGRRSAARSPHSACSPRRIPKAASGCPTPTFAPTSSPSSGRSRNDGERARPGRSISCRSRPNGASGPKWRRMKRSIRMHPASLERCEVLARGVRGGAAPLSAGGDR